MKKYKKKNILRTIRVVAASTFFILTTLLFLDFTGTLHCWFGWMAKIQLLPAVLAANFVTIAVLCLLTFLFGRIYCSVICPLGVFQDTVSWLRGRLKKKNRFRFSWSEAKTPLRWGVFVVFVATLIAGAVSVAALLDPYSAYGRIAENLFSPVYRSANNLLSFFAERVESYAFYDTDVWIKSLPTFIVAFVTFAIVVFLSWRSGRTYCNTICPVGTLLGFMSRFSLMKIRIDTEKCRNCGLCTKQCKASCIDMKNHKVDASRCVVCMDCLSACSEGAISYGFRKKRVLGQGSNLCTNQSSGEGSNQGSNQSSSEGSNQSSNQNSNQGSNQGSGEAHTITAAAPSEGRRAFILSSALIAGTVAAKAQEMKTDGGLAPIIRKKPYKRSVPITPAGSCGVKEFYDHCTACQLCVASCPNNVLRPSSSIDSFMQPEMSYERGYCRPECTECSQVCPAGAIKKITKEEKSSIAIGLAVTDYSLCLPYNGKSDCGNCARHCPSGAIKMVGKDPEDKESKKIPVVNPERCIGCGACEHLCPVSPLSAIHVEGNERHHIK